MLNVEQEKELAKRILDSGYDPFLVCTISGIDFSIKLKENDIRRLDGTAKDACRTLQMKLVLGGKKYSDISQSCKCSIERVLSK